MKTDKQIIFIPDFMIVLKALETSLNTTMNDLYTATRITHCHLYRIKKVLVEKGWVEVAVDGMVHNIGLTEKGREIVYNINKLLEGMGIDKDKLVEYRKLTKHKKEVVDGGGEGQVQTQETDGKGEEGAGQHTQEESEGEGKEQEKAQ